MGQRTISHTTFRSYSVIILSPEDKKSKKRTHVHRGFAQWGFWFGTCATDAAAAITVHCKLNVYAK